MNKTTLSVDSINDARRMLTRATERLHQLTGCVQNTDVMSQERAKDLRREVLTLMHDAAVALETDVRINTM